MSMSKIGLLGVSVVILLSACSENMDFQGYSPEQYRLAYPMENKVESRHLLIELRFKGKSQKLSSKDIHDLREILNNVSPNAVDYITFKISSKMQYKAQRVQSVKNMLIKSGYKSTVNIVSKEDVPNNSLAIDIVHAAVVPPDCPDWRKSPVTTYSNTPHTNYGCAATVNLGLMVDNPRDLVRGRNSSSSNATRADKVLSDYRSGTASSDASATATTSSVTGQ